MSEEIERWEGEGGAFLKQWEKMTRAEKRGFIWRSLNNFYPRIEYVDMDGSIFLKSLESYDTGDIVEHEGREYRVLYGWHWTTYGPIPVYMAELEPASVPEDESRMRR